MKIFVASHGKFASGIKNSVRILLGNVDRITAFDAYLDEKTVQNALESFIKNLDDHETAILVSDLYGGSVNQILYQYLERDNTFLIAGVNLALLMEVVLYEGEINEAILQKIVSDSQETMKLVSLTHETHEEEFF